MADLGFGAIGQGPIGDQGPELNFILTNQVGGSTVIVGLISVDGQLTTQQIQQIDSVGLVYDNGILSVTQVQSTEAIVLVEDRGVVATEQVQYSTITAFATITSGGLLSTKQVQGTNIYVLVEDIATAATSQIQTVSSASLVYLSGTSQTRQIQILAASGNVITFTTVQTQQLQSLQISALIEDKASIATAQQAQSIAVTTLQLSVGTTNTKQLQTTITSGSVTTLATTNTKQVQTARSRARLLLYAYVAYDVFNSNSVSIIVDNPTAITIGSTITWDGAPAGLFVTEPATPAAIEVLTLNEPVTVAAGTPVVIELFYIVYGSITTRQVQTSELAGEVIVKPNKQGVDGGSGVYYGPFGAPFLIPLNQNWWPYGRRKSNRIEIATRFGRMERWKGIEYNTKAAPPRPKIVASIPIPAQPKIREDLFTVRSSVPKLLPGKENIISVSSPQFITATIGNVDIGDFVVRESGEITINNLQPKKFTVESSLRSKKYNIDAKIEFNKNFTVGVKFNNPDKIKD
jgi:hypothetical protein